jgi:phosphopantetheine adenylyltransferase
MNHYTKTEIDVIDIINGGLAPRVESLKDNMDENADRARIARSLNDMFGTSITEDEIECCGTVLEVVRLVNEREIN